MTAAKSETEAQLAQVNAQLEIFLLAEEERQAEEAAKAAQQAENNAHQGEWAQKETTRAFLSAMEEKDLSCCLMEPGEDGSEQVTLLFALQGGTDALFRVTFREEDTEIRCELPVQESLSDSEILETCNRLNGLYRFARFCYGDQTLTLWTQTKGSGEIAAQLLTKAAGMLEASQTELEWLLK